MCYDEPVRKIEKEQSINNTQICEKNFANGNEAFLSRFQPVIVGVGHCCQDYICTVEAYPPEDGSTHILSMDDTQGGGAVATALAAASRLGAKARMLARLGDDETGTRILKGLSDFRVDVSLVSRVPGGRSSSSYVMVNPQNGSRTKFPYRDNLPPLSFDSPEQAAIAEADALHLDGTNYINAVHAARIARQSGTLVSLDGCSRQADNDLNRQLAAMADLLVMNAVYPFRVSERQDREDALRYMAGLGPAKAVLMTAGADGVYALEGGRVRHYPAFQVKAVDTTGAGDVFHGAFLTRWLETEDLEESIRFAQAASALKCLKTGGRAGIPGRKQLEAFLEARA